MRYYNNILLYSHKQIQYNYGSNPSAVTFKNESLPVTKFVDFSISSDLDGTEFEPFIRRFKDFE